MNTKRAGCPRSQKKVPGARASCPHAPAEPKGWYSRGYLPHLDAPGLVQALTFRLADSLPADVMSRLADDPDRRRIVEATIDQGLGSCLLRDAGNAEVVQNALLHFDGQRYRLLAWVIMPNHVHCLIETDPRWPVDRLVHSWKSYTSTVLNRLSERSGRLWQPDYFDRYIRDDAHLAAAIAYIESNPVKAGLCASSKAWPWGSAATRAGCPRSQGAFS